jgi:hypothetical protein
LEAAAPPLGDDDRSSSLDGDSDGTGLPVAKQDRALHGAGNQEVDLYMDADAASPDAPNKETEKLVCRRFLPQVLR